MQITEVKIFLKEGQDKKLKAYATLTLDNCFVVRNVKIIEGNKGLFVAMPSRKLKDPCPKCHFRNTVRSKFCNQCGASLPMPDARPPIASEDNGKQSSEHKDIAHPITTECRDYIQKKVLEAYDLEKVKDPSAAQPAPAVHAAPAVQPAPKVHIAPAVQDAPEKSLPSRPYGSRDTVDDDADIEL
jgi:DNA-binding cell septation regulator SpoVG